MARIAGVDIPKDKRVEIGLRYIYGIGPAVSRRILQESGVDPDIRVRDLTEDDVSRLREVIDRDCRVEGELKKEMSLDVNRLIEIGCYRGLRHRRRLPLHGQRTRTNARTKRGTRQTIAGRGRRRGMAKK